MYCIGKRVDWSVSERHCRRMRINHKSIISGWEGCWRGWFVLKIRSSNSQKNRRSVIWIIERIFSLEIIEWRARSRSKNLYVYVSNDLQNIVHWTTKIECRITVLLLGLDSDQQQTNLQEHAKWEWCDEDNSGRKFLFNLQSFWFVNKHT